MEVVGLDINKLVDTYIKDHPEEHPTYDGLHRSLDECLVEAGLCIKTNNNGYKGIVVPVGSYPEYSDIHILANKRLVDHTHNHLSKEE